jgi:hypothetical protein
VIPFVRTGETITARFTPGERTLLTSLAHQLIAMLEERAAESPADLLYAQLGIGGQSSAPLDPALARLLPDAYRDDAEAASEHRRFTELGLVERKAANARTVIRALADETVRLDAQQVQSWLRHLTDLRLVIAARLQIEDDDDEGTGDDAVLDLYDWLGYLQGTLVECLP